MTLDDLAARVAALELRQCKCPTCVQAERERARVARVERFTTVTQLSDDDRALELERMPVGDRRAYLDHCDAPTCARVMLALPDEVRERLMVDVPPRYLDHVEIELLARDGKVPHHVRLSTEHTIAGGRLEVTPRDAREHASALGSALTSEQGGQRWYLSRIQFSGLPGRPAIVVLAHAEMRARMVLDQHLASAIQLGDVKLEDLSIDEDKRVLAERWRVTPRHLRNP